MMTETPFFSCGLFMNERNRPQVDELIWWKLFSLCRLFGSWESLNFEPYDTGSHFGDSVCRSRFLRRPADLQKPSKQISLYYGLRKVRRPRHSEDRSSNQEEGALISRPDLRPFRTILTNFYFVS